MAEAYDQRQRGGEADSRALPTERRAPPDHLLGRLNASYRLVAQGSAPLGAALGGVVATVWSVEAVFWAAGAVFVVALPICRTS
jgi:hypothetical protein